MQLKHLDQIPKRMGVALQHEYSHDITIECRRCHREHARSNHVLELHVSVVSVEVIHLGRHVKENGFKRRVVMLVNVGGGEQWMGMQKSDESHVVVSKSHQKKRVRCRPVVA